jgi:hypothetical protein
MGGGIGAIGEVVVLGSLAQTVKDDAGLNGCDASCGIEGGEAVEMAREVEDNGDVGGLAGDAGACSTWKDGCVDGAASGNGGLDIGGVARKDDTHGKLAVVGGIGCVEGARRKTELDFAAERGFETGLKLAMGCESLMIERRLAKEFGDLVGSYGHCGPMRNERWSEETDYCK